MKSKFGFAAILFVSLYISPLIAQVAHPANEGFAAEDFRRGVQSFYRGAFNDAVILFEKALSNNPENNLYLDWLGKAYYHAGMEGAALENWQAAADNNYGGLLLQNKIDIVQNRRLSVDFNKYLVSYTEAGSFPGTTELDTVFVQPMAILPNNDGTFWVVAYSSNELLRLDINGTVVFRTGGPLQGFDRPMDIARCADGSLLVTEYAGNRISQLSSEGRYIKSFGTTGVGNGQLVGPQYIAVDSYGNIFVTDFGNARIVVFDSQGNPLFFFGKKDGDFPGFSAPAGIAIIEDVVYAADAISGAIYSFDLAGNYEDVIVPPKTFTRPEAMKAIGQYLIIADNKRIVTVDTATGAVFENVKTGNAPSRIMCATPDQNGNILASDFVTNEIYVMSRMTELVGGLFVQIERVIADNFPNIILEVRVENRSREPVVGLKANNFFITENKAAVENQRLTGAASENTVCDITLVIDRSPDTSALKEAVETAVRDISSSMNGRGTLRIISAGAVPTLEYQGAPTEADNFDLRRLKNPVSDNCRIDLGIRFAANELINAEKKRAIIYITSGTVSDGAFSDYSLSDLTAYTNNNGIPFSIINLKQQALPEELDYLTRRTNGIEYYVYRPQGLKSVVSDMLELPNGLYQLSYTSHLSTDFGTKYLPVEIETYLLNRSGRDETGYFAPLE